jgi:hypothetical protein
MSGWLYFTVQDKGYLHSELIHTLHYTVLVQEGEEETLVQHYCNNMVVETRMVVNNIM